MEKSTETMKYSFDIENLKDIIKKYPELKENISSVLLSEFIIKKVQFLKETLMIVNNLFPNKDIIRKHIHI